MDSCQEIAKFVKEIGFPVAVCFYLFWRDMKINVPMRDAIIELVTMHKGKEIQ
jgi:hypothetical protein